MKIHQVVAKSFHVDTQMDRNDKAIVPFRYFANISIKMPLMQINHLVCTKWQTHGDWHKVQRLRVSSPCVSYFGNRPSAESPKRH